MSTEEQSGAPKQKKGLSLLEELAVQQKSEGTSDKSPETKDLSELIDVFFAFHFPSPPISFYRTYLPLHSYANNYQENELNVSKLLDFDPDSLDITSNSDTFNEIFAGGSSSVS